MKYKVVEAESREGLEAAVQEAMLDVLGWEPHGGVAVSHAVVMRENERKGYQEAETSTIWAQAMVSRAVMFFDIL